MPDDFRVSVGLFSHHKYKMLKRRLGPEGVISLFILWAFCVQNKPTGRLDGLTIEEIEVTADWDGEPGKFVTTLLELKWLEQDESETFIVHDWCQHNPYAASSDERSDRARFSRLAQIDKKLYKKLKSEGVTKISADELNRLITSQPTVNETPAKRQPTVNETPAPSPSHNRLTTISNSLPEPDPLPPPQPSEKNAVVADDCLKKFHDALTELAHLIPDDNAPVPMSIVESIYIHHHGKPRTGQMEDLLTCCRFYNAAAIDEALEASREQASKNPAAWIKSRLERKEGSFLASLDPAWRNLHEQEART